jgi:hypothetical protein
MTQQDVRSYIEAAEYSYWPQPEDIKEDLLPVPFFDFSLLPEVAEPWVRDIAERIQCPPEYLMVTFYSSIGSLVGRKVGIRPQANTDWTEVPNIWGMIVGNPSAMKSPSMKEALKPINWLEANAREKFRREMEEFSFQKELYESAKKKDDGLRPPLEPKAKRHIVIDTSYEALGVILATNKNGVLAYRDEIISLLKPLDQEQNAPARGFFLSAWNGTQPYSFDRILRGITYIEAACVTLLGGTQPGKLKEYISKAQGGGDDGMVQRFSLLVWPDLQKRYQEFDRHPDTAARERVMEVFDRIDKLDPKEIGAQQGKFDDIPFLRFEEPAREAFSAWRRVLEERLRSGELRPCLESHLGKYKKLVPALALIIHLVDVGRGPVTQTALIKAIACANFLESHARRAYAAGLASPTQSAAIAIAKRLKNGSIRNGFSARDIHQKDWMDLTDHGHVSAALELLEELWWIRKDKIETNGRPKHIYSINPRIKPLPFSDVV